MEKFMSKVVGKPNLVADDRLNAKIDRIFSVDAFQRMVENADVFQDISSMGNNSSMMNMLNQSEAGRAAQSFKKVLPTHSQMQEEDDEAVEEDMNDAPHFGQTSSNNPNRHLH